MIEDEIRGVAESHLTPHGATYDTIFNRDGVLVTVSFKGGVFLALHPALRRARSRARGGHALRDALHVNDASSARLPGIARGSVCSLRRAPLAPTRRSEPDVDVPEHERVPESTRRAHPDRKVDDPAPTTMDAEGLH